MWSTAKNADEEIHLFFVFFLVGGFGPLCAQKCGPDRIRTGDLVLDRDVC